MDGTTLEYEDMPLSKSKRKVSTKQGKKWTLEPLSNVGTSAILSFLVRRHKFGLLTLVFLIENALLIAKWLRVV